MCPGARAPISTTSASQDSPAARIVSGTPSSLLNERGLAVVAYRCDNTDRRRSLVDVFPTEPVTAATRLSVIRTRHHRASSASAAVVSVTSTAVAPRAPSLVR